MKISTEPPVEPPQYKLLHQKCLQFIGQQQSPEQLVEARKALELVQSLEREKQKLQFQRDQHKLNMEQAKASHDMEKEFQKAMQMQGIEPTPKSDASQGNKPIKLALRKR